jgi:hypothetical protein
MFTFHYFDKGLVFNKNRPLQWRWSKAAVKGPLNKSSLRRRLCRMGCAKGDDANG